MPTTKYSLFLALAGHDYFINHYALNLARVPLKNRSETFCTAPKISNIKSPKIYAIRQKFIYHLLSMPQAMILSFTLLPVR